MLRACIIDLESGREHYLPLVEFIASYEALYGRRCRTPICWSNLSKRKIVGPKLIQKAESIVLRFGDKGKLIPKYFGPYEIIERIRPVAYCLTLPLELQKIHNEFHVSMFR
ncbi:coilin-like [Gossypium australe]|uniref:Coilin-like n=1 Tax=Gossypium australe TaxID=47621 RepID=A0A5B6WKJ7_9ROSI|nr:coilin-like [Gossypium australe]